MRDVRIYTATFQKPSLSHQSYQSQNMCDSARDSEPDKSVVLESVVASALNHHLTPRPPPQTTTAVCEKLSSRLLQHILCTVDPQTIIRTKDNTKPSYLNPARPIINMESPIIVAFSASPLQKIRERNRCSEFPQNLSLISHLSSTQFLYSLSRSPTSSCMNT